MIENISVKVDDVGRIVIPKKVRKELEININDILLLSINENKIEMKKRKNSDKLDLLIQKMKDITKDYHIDVILADNFKVVFSNIESLKDKNVINSIKKISINEIVKSKETKLTNDYIINDLHYYCSFYLNVYTKYNLFIIYKDTKNEVLAKNICELLLI